MERKILVAFLRTWLKERFDELGRKFGPNLDEATMKEVKPVLLECLVEAFNGLVEERRKKYASQQ